MPLLELLRVPVVVEWRRGLRQPRTVRLNSTSGTLLTELSRVLAIGGGLLLVWATFSTLASRWAEPLAELGTAVAVVGVVTLNVRAARSPRGRLFWRVLALLLGAVGLGVVFGGVVHSEQWISVFSHLAVGLLAVVILETALVGAFNALDEWSDGAKNELVLTNRWWPVSIRSSDAVAHGQEATPTPLGRAELSDD